MSEFSRISVATALEQIEQHKAVVVDIRDVADVLHLHALGAQVLDLEELATLDAMGYTAHDDEEGGLGIDDTDTEAGRSGPRVRPRRGRDFRGE